MAKILLSAQTPVSAFKDFLLTNKDAELYTKEKKDGTYLKTGAMSSIFKEKIDASRARTRRACMGYVKAKSPQIVAKRFNSFLAGNSKDYMQPIHGGEILFALAESQYTPLIDSIENQNIQNKKQSLNENLKTIGWPKTFFTEMSFWASDQAKAETLPAPPFAHDPSKFNLALNYVKHAAIKDTLFTADAEKYKDLENKTREFIDQNLANRQNKDLHDLFTESGVVSSAALREILNAPNNSFLRGIELSIREFIKNVEDQPKTEEKRREKLIKIYHLAKEITKTGEKAINRIKFGAQLFTDEQYLLLYPESQRPILHAIGQSMKEMAKELESDTGAFQALLRIAHAAESNTTTFLSDFSKLRLIISGDNRKHKIFDKKAYQANHAPAPLVNIPSQIGMQ